MRSPFVLSSFILAAPLVIRLAAADLAPLTSVQLHELCLAYVEAPESEDAKACAAYVRGFIEGSDRIVLLSDDPAQGSEETFSERAWRTRLGIRSPKPRYCLKEAVSMEEFITQLLMYAEHKPPERDANAHDILYGALSRFHRCSR
jgi:hypothetical protein